MFQLQSAAARDGADGTNDCHRRAVAPLSGSTDRGNAGGTERERGHSQKRRGAPRPKAA
jgi:hypothetical protein